MTDTAQDAANAESPSLPPLIIHGQYIKDLSFEVPGAPDIFSKMQQAPEVPIAVDVNARKLSDDTYEVTLQFRVDAKVGGEPAFILELLYGAIVELHPEEPDHTQPLLLIEAPRTIFPFARNMIADITRDGGFPPLMLQPIDFVQMFRQRLEAAARAQQEGNHENKPN